VLVGGTAVGSGSGVAVGGMSVGTAAGGTSVGGMVVGETAVSVGSGVGSSPPQAMRPKIKVSATINKGIRVLLFITVLHLGGHRVTVSR